MTLNKKKNRVILLVSILIFFLSFGLSIVNYLSAFEQTRKQLKENSLPLSTDNIYADIQKIIIEPSIISSMMSSDTFVHDWFRSEEENPEKIVKYLDAVKTKYGYDNTFLASVKTRNYYTSDGLLEALSPDKADNSWYFRFLDDPAAHEINIDNNELIDNNLLLFFNYKIFNNDNKLLGVSGIVFKTAFISEIFRKFREDYKLKVYLADRNGKITLSEQGIRRNNESFNEDFIHEVLHEVLRSRSGIFDFEYDSRSYIIKSKYIEELGQYLIVQAELDEFTETLQNKLIGNLLVSLIITILIVIIILRTFMSYTSQLNRLAHYDALTGLPNRRTFQNNLQKIWNNHKKENLEACLILFDLDNFKLINDNSGHQTGDSVLIRVSAILQGCTEDSDYLSRWGGEEFSILLKECKLENALERAQTLRKAISEDVELQKLTGSVVTASFGVTAFDSCSSGDDIVRQADLSLYKAKNSGKDCVKFFE